MLICMTRNLIECQRHTNKNFGFDTILCSLFFERVSSLIPREMVWGHVASFPAVTRWATLLPQQGGGRSIEVFNDLCICCLNMWGLCDQQISLRLDDILNLRQDQQHPEDQ
jgi:hypothetical protein